MYPAKCTAIHTEKSRLIIMQCRHINIRNGRNQMKFAKSCTFTKGSLNKIP